MDCSTPIIKAFAHEGSWWVLVEATGIDNGVAVELSTGDTGEFLGGLALVELSEPLTAGRKLTASIDAVGCQVTSCEVFVSSIEGSDYSCDFGVYDQPAGFLTGRMICVGKDLYHQVWDGEGGVINDGILIQESCVECGGINPRCDNDPVLPRYWNVVRCSNGMTYQTSTELLIPGQRVSHPTFGDLRWDNTYTDTLTPANNIGTVTIVSGQTGCPAGSGGGSGSLYFNLVSCANGQIYQTPTTISFPNQRVSHELHGELYWNGETTSVASNLLGPVTPLGATGCSGGGGGGGTLYYNIVSCAGGGIYHTPTVISLPNQRVSTPLGEHFWNGDTTTTPTHPRSSTIMYGSFGCG